MTKDIRRTADRYRYFCHICRIVFRPYHLLSFPDVSFGGELDHLVPGSRRQKSKAAQILASDKVEIVENAEPKLTQEKASMLKVRVEKVCLCGSDSLWFAYDHRVSENTLPTRWSSTVGKESVYPLTPGLATHECLGTMVASTSSRFKEGDLVLAMPPGHAGLCGYFCFSNQQAISLPRKGLSLEQVLMTQPLRTVLWACRRLCCPLHTGKVVVSTGPGLLITHTLSNLGARTVTTLQRFDYRLAATVKMRGAHTLNVNRSNPADTVLEITVGVYLFVIRGIAPNGITTWDIFMAATPSIIIQAVGLVMCFPELTTSAPRFY